MVELDGIYDNDRKYVAEEIGDISNPSKGA